MQKNAVFGWVFFLVLAAAGAWFFNNGRVKAEAEAQSGAYTYFSSLMTEDKSQTVNNPSGGAPLHPWALTSTPTQPEIEEKVLVKRTSDGSGFTWEVNYDPTGGKNPKTFHVKCTFDNQGKLSTLSGLHGTVTTFAGGWLPDTAGG